MYGSSLRLSIDRTCNVVGHLYGLGDVVANVVFAHKSLDVGALQSEVHVFTHAGENDEDALLLGGSDENLQVVNTC